MPRRAGQRAATGSSDPSAIPLTGRFAAGSEQEANGRPRHARLTGTVNRLEETPFAKSQVAFRRRRGFAYVWRPGQYVGSDVPAVLSIALPHEVSSGRFKSVVHPSPTVWMHHLELHDVTEVDDQVRGWLVEAHAAAS